MFLENEKHINAKVYRNGKFQVTGCKTDDHFIRSIIQIYNIMKLTQEWTGESIFTMEKDKYFNDEQTLNCMFYTAMKNMDFDIGFHIEREKLDRFMHDQTNYISIFTDGDLSTGVNVKVKYDLNAVPDLTKFVYISGDPNPLTTSELLNIQKEEVQCFTFNELLDEKERKKLLKKEKFHTFLVFASGSIIMSSRGPDMRRVFIEVVDVLINNRQYFEEFNKKSIKTKIREPEKKISKNDYENNSSHSQISDNNITWDSENETE